MTGDGGKNVVRGLLTRRVLFPAIQLALRNHCWDEYRTLDETQWQTPEAIADLQREKLGRLLSHAYVNVPLYRRAFRAAGLTPADIRGPEDLSRLPIQDRAHLRAEHPHGTVAPGAAQADRIPNSTSGSTGSPFEFVMSRQLVGMRWARYLRGNTWAGLRLGDRHLRIWGRHDRPFYEKAAISLTLNLRELSAFDITRENVSRYAETIRRYRPRCVEGYASSVVKLARLLIEAGIDDVRVPSVITSAENLYAGDRARVERALGCEVFDRYGAREFGAIAHECGVHQGQHLNAESFIVEVVGDDGAPVGDGPGRLIVTNLDNFTMPLIRYEIGDTGALSGARCPCGRGLPLLASIDGRLTDFLETPSGEVIPFLFWNYFFEPYGPSVQQFQVTQTALDAYEIRLVPAAKFSATVREAILDGAREHLGDVRLEVIEVEEIPLGKNGKQACVQSLIR